MDDQNAQATAAETDSLPVEFKFEGHVVRTVSKDDETRFVAADVCEVLELTDTGRPSSDSTTMKRVRTLFVPLAAPKTF
jgi:prophage antirepressor-like protein